MPEFTAKDVKALRDATGAGMMDAKRALEESSGGFDQAAKLLREKGLGKAAKRSDRENAQGAVAVASRDGAAAIVALRCETDFTAKSDKFITVAQALADAVLADGEGAVDAQKDAVDELKISTQENVELGDVVRVDANAGDVLDTYIHRQDGRGVNAVVVELAGGTAELAHDIAVHIAFAKPAYLTRDEVDSAAVEEERATLENITRAEGKPEQALPKIVEGRLNGWFKERVLLEQPYARDDKQSVQQLLGDATVVRFHQVVIGA